MPHTLLLADDSTTIQRVVELTFAGEDVRVVAVSDGEQAIARVQSDSPDIVLADIGVPGRSGYEISAFIKTNAALCHIPVLLLAGAFEPVDEGRARQAGCDGVLVKPFEPRQIVARVRELLGGAAETPTQAVPAVPDPADRVTAPALVSPPPEPQDPPSRPLRLVSTPPRSSESIPSPGLSSQSLDDYFDQLDAAFAARAEGPAPPYPAVPEDLTPAPPEASELASLESGPARAEGDEELIEKIAQRVAERLASTSVRDVVSDVVSEVTERLIRGELDRIARGSGPKA